MRGWVLLFALYALPAGAAELKLATWDLGWLTLRPAGEAGLPDNVHPKSATDLALLAGYAARLDADIVALQGVDDAAVAEAVFPPARYTLILAGDAVLQHTGFAIRQSLAANRNPDLLALDPYPAARLHLRAGSDVTLQLGGQTLRLLSVHLKSGCRDGALEAATAPGDTGARSACATLLRQAQVLERWVRDRAADPAASFVVLGDFGRVMEGGDDLAARIGGATTLRRATAGHASPCWGPGPFVDDILIGGPAGGWVQPASLRVMVFHETGAEWRDRLSSHCPVSVRLTLPE